jgi:hypothetical protein
VRRRRVRSEAKTVKVVEADATEPSEAETTPHFIVEPPDAVPEIVVNHAYDLSLHLAERLREVERRELAVAEYETKLQEAEAGARVWVFQRDMELSALERELQLKSDEIQTQSAAVAAAEIAAEQEFRSQQAVLRQREAELDQLAAELTDREERLHSERSALDQALDKLRAERRRDEELQRSRQQKWQVLLEGDRAQAERTLINLQKHRLALEERERALNAREQAPPALSLRTAEGRREEHQDLSLSVLRAEAARDHRLALEHRWIAGQLWARLAGSALASDDELQDSLENVRGQLEMMYRREREALEDLQSSLADTVRQIQPAPREVRSRSKPRTLAFTG